MSAYTSTILVTGGTTGLGYWAAYELARQSPTSKVIISSRVDRENAVTSLNNLLSKHRSNTNTQTPQVEFIPLDLASTANVRAFVKILTSKFPTPITALLLNAGIQFHEGKSIRTSPDGIESTFAVNHVGHALLFFLLKPYLAHSARIVLTASGTHDPVQMARSRLPPVTAEYTTAELLAHPTDNEGYEINNRGVNRYASSKLANVIFMYALEQRLQQLRTTGAKDWTVIAMDPGLLPGTSLARDAGIIANWIFVNLAPYMMWLLKWALRSDNVHTPQESGLYLAEHGLVDGQQALDQTGRYFEGRKVVESSDVSRDVERQEDLWGWTVKFLGQDESERAEFGRFE